MTVTAERTREMRLRRTAERRGYTLTKSRRRDPRALAYGRWWVKRDQETVFGGGPSEGATLNEVEDYLNGQRREKETTE